MGSYRIIEFNNYRVCINEETYEPAEDTELLLELIKINKGEEVIDIGSGSGILGLHALKLGARKVFFVDINPYATLSTLCTLNLNKVNEYDVVNCDLVTCFREKTFDVAIFNPPYLPYEEYDKWIGYSWSGGKTGVEVLIRFLNMIKARRIYTLYSSLDDEELLFEVLKKKYRIRNRKEKTIGFETLIALELE